MFAKSKFTLDISGSIIKALEGKLLGDNAIKVCKAAYLDMSSIIYDKERFDKCFKNGRLINCEDNVNSIKTFLKKLKISAKKVMLNISDEKIITRILSLPRLPVDDLENLMEMELPKHFPVELSKFRIDYKILGQINNEDRVYYKLLVCAIPKNIIREYTDMILDCGLTPTVIDIHPNSLSRLYRNQEFEDIAIIEGGIHQAELLILERGNFFIHTTFPFEFDNYSEIINNPASFDKAVMDNKIMELTENIKNYIKFYLSKNEGKTIDTIYLTGEISMINGIEDIMRNEFNLQVIKGIDKTINIKKSKSVSGVDINFYCGNLGALLREE